MKRISRLAVILLSVIGFSLPSVLAAEAKGKLLLSDDFEREESSPEKEEVGNGWSTNSKSRAKGVKQVDLRDGTIHISRAKVADHGVSVVHDLEFRDVTIQLRFKLGKGDDLGVNIADMKEKGVHAGHICMAKVKLNQVEIHDLKTGRMKKETREIRQAGKETPELKKLLATKTKRVKVNLAADTWHQLEIRIDGDRMRVRINGKQVNEFKSPGIAHATKSRIRLAVNKSAWVDDVKVWGRGGK